MQKPRSRETSAVDVIIVLIIIVYYFTRSTFFLCGPSCKESTHSIQYGKNHDAYIGKDGKPHIGDADRSQEENNQLDTDREPCVLVDDGQAFTGNPDRLGNLHGIIIHKNHIRRFDCRVRPHCAHGNSDICAGEHGSVIDTVSDKGKISISFILQKEFFHVLHLISRQELAAYLVDAKFLCYSVSDFFRMTVLATPTDFRAAMAAFDVSFTTSEIIT